jgi:hypothetical protein
MRPLELNRRGCEVVRGACLAVEARKRLCGPFAGSCSLGDHVVELSPLAGSSTTSIRATPIIAVGGGDVASAIGQTSIPNDLNVRVVSECADQQLEQRKLTAANDDESLIQGVSAQS